MSCHGWFEATTGWPHKSQNKIPGVFQVRFEKFQVSINITYTPYLMVSIIMHEMAARK